MKPTVIVSRFLSQILAFLFTTASAQTVLLFEDFETGNFSAKGWYDGFPDQRTTAEFKNGAYSYAGRFLQGATTSGAGRHLFTATDKLYMSYWVKYSSNYVGSGVGYHPHEWNILTTADGNYQGPADTYLTAYIEQNAGRPILALQDSKNVDPNCILLNNNSFVGCNGNFSTYVFSENRSVCSCNGLKGYLDRRDCFANSGSSKGYYSARIWDADLVYFRNTAGPYYKNNWHFIETYFELNTITGGVGIPNGKIRYWYDGKLLIASDSILFRTAQHPNMKFNQLIYGPYIGVGSPVDQTWWVDDLTIMNGMPSTGVSRLYDKESEVVLYPNPSEGNFTVELPEKAIGSGSSEIKIFDFFGCNVFRQELFSKQQSIQVQLVSGVYFYRITNSETLVGNGKIIIRKK